MKIGLKFIINEQRSTGNKGTILPLKKVLSKEPIGFIT